MENVFDHHIQNVDYDGHARAVFADIPTTRDMRSKDTGKGMF